MLLFPAGTRIRKIVGTENRECKGTVIGSHISEWSGFALNIVVFDNGHLDMTALPETLKELPVVHGTERVWRLFPTDRPDPLGPITK